MMNQPVDRDRLINTLNDCGILALAPTKQDQLADKLMAEGFTPERIAKAWRICKYGSGNNREASAALTALLREPKDKIERVLLKGREADPYPGAAQMRSAPQERRPETDKIRACRMAYALVVADRKTHAQAAWEIGCEVEDIPILLERWTELVTPDVVSAKKQTTDPQEHNRRIQEFRKTCKGNQLPLDPSMAAAIQRNHATPYR
jgi:hypothetical protein